MLIWSFSFVKSLHMSLSLLDHARLESMHLEVADELLREYEFIGVRSSRSFDHRDKIPENILLGHQCIQNFFHLPRFNLMCFSELS